VLCEGHLETGNRIAEATSGNTGISFLAIAGPWVSGVYFHGIFFSKLFQNNLMGREKTFKIQNNLPNIFA